MIEILCVYDVGVQELRGSYDGGIPVRDMKPAGEGNAGHHQIGIDRRHRKRLQMRYPLVNLTGRRRPKRLAANVDVELCQHLPGEAEVRRSDDLCCDAVLLGLI